MPETVKIHQRMRQRAFPDRHRSQNDDARHVERLQLLDRGTEMIEIGGFIPHRLQQDDVRMRRREKAECEVVVGVASRSRSVRQDRRAAWGSEAGSAKRKFLFSLLQAGI